MPVNRVTLGLFLSHFLLEEGDPGDFELQIDNASLEAGLGIAKIEKLLVEDDELVLAGLKELVACLNSGL